MRANASLLPIDFAGMTTRRTNLVVGTGRDLSGPRACPDDRQPRERTTTRVCPVRVQGVSNFPEEGKIVRVRPRLGTHTQDGFSMSAGEKPDCG